MTRAPVPNAGPWKQIPIRLMAGIGVGMCFVGCEPRAVEQRVRGVRMEPTFADGQRIRYIKRKAPKSGLKPGDVIVHKWGKRSAEKNPTPEALMISRIIGRPGDSLLFDGTEWRVGTMSIGKQEIGQGAQYKFLNRLPTSGTTVPENCYFVVGDNRKASWDSRGFGWVGKEEIVG